jgi:hypothetical protein
VQLAATGTPQAAIWFLRAFQQQHLVPLIETVEQRGDFVGQRHAASETGAGSAGKPCERRD